MTEVLAAYDMDYLQIKWVEEKPGTSHDNQLTWAP